jgi:hypothetical protein
VPYQELACCCQPNDSSSHDNHVEIPVCRTHAQAARTSFDLWQMLRHSKSMDPCLHDSCACSHVGFFRLTSFGLATIFRKVSKMKNSGQTKVNLPFTSYSGPWGHCFAAFVLATVSQNVKSSMGYGFRSEMGYSKEIQRGQNG